MNRTTPYLIQSGGRTSFGAIEQIRTKLCAFRKRITPLAHGCKPRCFVGRLPPRTLRSKPRALYMCRKPFQLARVPPLLLTNIYQSAVCRVFHNIQPWPSTFQVLPAGLRNRQITKSVNPFQPCHETNNFALSIFTPAIEISAETIVERKRCGSLVANTRAVMPNRTGCDLVATCEPIVEQKIYRQGSSKLFARTPPRMNPDSPQNFSTQKSTQNSTSRTLALTTYFGLGFVLYTFQNNIFRIKLMQLSTT